MRRRALVLAIAMLTLGSVRAGPIDVDFNPKAEFERYKTWGWTPDRDQKRFGVLADETMRQRVEKYLAGCLLEAGLRPAGPNESPDILVRYMGDTGTGKTVNTVDGFYYDPFAPAAYSTVQMQQQGVTFMVDLIDSSMNALAWRLYVNQKIGSTTDTSQKFWEALGKGFEKYPPSASARAKKAKELEKRSKAK